MERDEVLTVTGVMIGPVEANDTGIKNIKRTARLPQPANYKSAILLRSAVRMAA